MITDQNVNRQNIFWHPEAIPGDILRLTLEGGSDTTESVGVRGTNVEGHLPTKPAQHGTVRALRTVESSIPESTDVPEPNRGKLTGKEPSKVPATFQPTAFRMRGHHFTGELPLVVSGRVRSAGVGDSNAESGDSDRHLAPSLAKKEGVRHHNYGKRGETSALQNTYHIIIALPPYNTILLPEEPSTIREAQTSLGWS